MNRIAPLAIASFLCACLWGAGPKASLVLITPSLAEAPDEYRAAALLASGAGGAVSHVILEEAALKKKEKVTEAIIAACAPESVKAIIVSPAPHGTLAAFLELAAARPALFRAAVSPREDLLALESSASLIAGTDVVGRAWALARTATLKGMAEIAFLGAGAPAFGEEGDARFKAVLKAQCAAEGVLLTERPSGQELALFLKERAAARPGKVMVWNHDSRLRQEVIALTRDLKLFLAEGPHPSLLTDYAELSGLNPATEDADYQKILKKAEKVIIDGGSAGRYGTWVLPQGWLLTLGLGRAVLEGDLQSRKAILLDKIQKHFAKPATGVRYALSYSIDPITGIRSQNHLVFREDPYVLGKGFLSLSPGKVPQNLYFLVK